MRSPVRPTRRISARGGRGVHSSFMGEIHEFILARVHEDGLAALVHRERHGAGRSEPRPSTSGHDLVWGPDRVLAEGEIKNEIVSIHGDGACSQCLIGPAHGCETIRLLAKTWSSHPDYNSDWSGFSDSDYQMSSARATEILAELSSPDCPPMATLSDLGTDVLRLIANGVDYRDIGTQLFVSLNVVTTIARNCVKKSEFYRRWGNWPGPGGWPA